MSLNYKFDYVNLGRSETLENLVSRRLGSLEKRVEMRDNSKKVTLKVKFVVDSRSAYGHLKDSHVVIEVKIPGIPKALIAKKKDADLRKAVTKAADTLLKEVRRYTEKQEHLRKH